MNYLESLRSACLYLGKQCTGLFIPPARSKGLETKGKGREVSGLGKSVFPEFVRAKDIFPTDDVNNMYEKSCFGNVLNSGVGGNETASE